MQSLKACTPFSTDLCWHILSFLYKPDKKALHRELLHKTTELRGQLDLIHHKDLENYFVCFGRDDDDGMWFLLPRMVEF